MFDFCSNPAIHDALKNTSSSLLIGHNTRSCDYCNPGGSRKSSDANQSQNISFPVCNSDLLLNFQIFFFLSRCDVMFCCIMFRGGVVGSLSLVWLLSVRAALHHGAWGCVWFHFFGQFFKIFFTISNLQILFLFHLIQSILVSVWCKWMNEWMMMMMMMNEWWWWMNDDDEEWVN